MAIPEVTGRMFVILAIGVSLIGCVSEKVNLMASDVRSEANSLNVLLQPMLVLQGPDAETQMGEALSEGLILPSAEKLQSSALPYESIMPALVDTQHWIEKVIRQRWLVPGYLQRLYAIPGGPDGMDRIIGAWKIDDRIIQIVATRERLHLITRTQDPKASNNLKNSFEQVYAEAHSLLAIDSEMDPASWQFRSFGGLSLGYQDHTSMKNWQQSLLVLTDGKAAKLSVLKLDNGDTPEVESLVPEPEPWFDS